MCHRIGHFPSQNMTLQAIPEVLRSNRRSLYKWVLFSTHLLGTFEQKRREGKGVPEKSVQKVIKKSVKSMVFKVQLFRQDQGARSRARSRSVRNCPGPRKVSRRTPFYHPWTLNTWVFPRLCPQGTSRYNTHLFRPVTH